MQGSHGMQVGDMCKHGPGSPSQDTDPKFGYDQAEQNVVKNSGSVLIKHIENVRASFGFQRGNMRKHGRGKRRRQTSFTNMRMEFLPFYKLGGKMPFPPLRGYSPTAQKIRRVSP